jgi:hypothetical protein
MLTAAEALAAIHRAGGQLQAGSGGALVLTGLAELPPELAAALNRHRPMLAGYVRCFPGGCWPSRSPPG